jgi:hypothetical protein
MAKKNVKPVVEQVADLIEEAQRKAKEKVLGSLVRDKDDDDLITDDGEIIVDDKEPSPRERKPKKDTMTGRQIVKYFEVSMPTLRRYVKDEKLTDYREKPHAKNAMLMLDPVEVVRYFGRKS